MIGNTSYSAIRKVKLNNHFGAGDVLVLFGELFQRGYANGLVDEARKRNMMIIRTTVGRREKNGTLRALQSEEIAAAKESGDLFINVPLEAGFDMEPDSKGTRPVDQLSDVKLSEWESKTVDEASLAESQKKGQERFQTAVRKFVIELETLLPEGKNIYFAHLMAGGVPRAKIVLPLMNRSLKGSGDRFLSSEKFWNSSLGKFAARNFFEVTAETFHILLQETSKLRQKVEKSGKTVFYSAYGYHGTEVLVEKNYLWQTYSPYLQGWAKMRLENHAREWSARGVHCCVYNCPEILTNSSAIFSGVEVSLYPLMGAIRLEAGQQQHHPRAEKILKDCQGLLAEPHTVQGILDLTGKYLSSKIIREHCVFEKWPQHNSQEQLEKMLDSSEELVSMHKDQKFLLTQLLSELVIEACGRVMINDAPHPESAVSWINHDLVAKTVLA